MNLNLKPRKRQFFSLYEPEPVRFPTTCCRYQAPKALESPEGGQNDPKIVSTCKVSWSFKRKRYWKYCKRWKRCWKRGWKWALEKVQIDFRWWKCLCSGRGTRRSSAVPVKPLQRDTKSQAAGLGVLKVLLHLKGEVETKRHKKEFCSLYILLSFIKSYCNKLYS